MTIDTFFQNVLRNLARELDLTANLRIELNDYQIEQQAVDELIESLEDTDRLLFWIMDYIKENIDDDKSWNVIGQIKKFGENIFKDYYKAHADKLTDLMEQEDFFKDFTDRMKKMRSKAKEQLKEIAATFFDSLEEEGFTSDDLAGKTRGIWSYFNKLKNGKYTDDDLYNATFSKCLESPEAWVKKSDVKDCTDIFNYVESVLYPILLFAEDNRPRLTRIFKSTDLTIKHLNQLRLLGSIDKKVREMNREANRFLLSDTQTLLNSLIKDSDSPFIFEKIGTQLDHIMIDEFQDTSVVQWKNFKVLLDECLSKTGAGTNLIVGDVFTVDARKISVEALGKYFPNSPMLAAAVAVTGVMKKDEFIHEMRASYKHKFAKKPEVIDGNMKALTMTFEALESDLSQKRECA